jgi:hypothetical protein
METELTSLPMEIYTRGNTIKGNPKDLGSIDGRMEVVMSVNS